MRETTDNIEFSQPALRIDCDAPGVPIERMLLARGDVSRTVAAAQAQHVPGEPPPLEYEWSDDAVKDGQSIALEGCDLYRIGDSVYLGFYHEGARDFDIYRAYPVEGEAVSNRWGVGYGPVEDEFDDARTRDGIDFKRAAALLRASGRPIGVTYGDIMSHMLSQGAEHGGAQRKVAELCAAVYAPISGAVVLQKAGGHPSAFSARELIQMDIAPPKWLVEGVFPEGVTLFAGKPKQGKSRLMRNIAFAMTSGGKALGSIDVEKAGVLYIDLDGDLAGLKQHVLQLAEGDPSKVPTGLDFRVEFPRGKAGLDELERYLIDHPDCRLVIVDTFSLFRETPDGRGSMYMDDNAATSAISKVCHRYGVSCILVHHASKRMADGVADVLDLASGSTGLVGGCDNGIVLSLTMQGPVLYLRPRNFPGADFALEFDDVLGSFRLLGDAAIHNASAQQAEILKMVDEGSGELQAHEIADMLGMDRGKVRMQLHRMNQKTPSLVEQWGRKQWRRSVGSLAQQEQAAEEKAAAPSKPKAPPVDPNAEASF